MEGLSPIFIMAEEHRLIRRGLELLDTAAVKVTRSKLPEGFWPDMVGFFKNFAGKCHHAKEESHLIPEIIRYNKPDAKEWCGLIIEEHEKGRELISEIEVYSRMLGNDPEAPLKLIKALRTYIKLLQAHIAKEDHMFPRLAMPFPRGLMERLFRSFEEEDRASIGSGGIEKYKDLIERLEKQLDQDPQHL
ncbi:MAG: hemerythrin domain-containing protein [Candidatus Woesearchaeota archaeon]